MCLIMDCAMPGLTVLLCSAVRPCCCASICYHDNVQALLLYELNLHILADVGFLLYACITRFLCLHDGNGCEEALSEAASSPAS